MLTWNIEGIKQHVYYLKEKFQEDCIDIAFLSEPQMFQHELKIVMCCLDDLYNYSLNSDDLYDLELPLKKSHARGGTMLLWKKWLDPYVTVLPSAKTSGFHVMVLSLPNCHVSFHVSVYLPTSGKDFDYTSQITDLRACMEDLLESYPNAAIYLRGDFNTNKKNSVRCSQLDSLMKALNTTPVEIPHKTYHHFTGQDSFDSQIDMILHSAYVSRESIIRIRCKFNEPEISSHHDVIISRCNIPRKDSCIYF